MESQHPDTVERIQFALGARDTSKMAQAFVKIEAREEGWKEESVLSYIVEELLNELIREKLPLILEEAAELCELIHDKIIEDQAHEFFGIADLEKQIQWNVFRHFVYAHRKQEPKFTPSERYRKKIVEGIAGGESPQGTEDELMQFYWSHGPERASVARGIDRGDLDRTNFFLKQEAGIWLRVPPEISDDVAVTRPLLEKLSKWNRDFRDPQAFYTEVQNRIAMWALERFHSKEEFARGSFFFQGFCLERLEPIYGPLLMDKDYLRAYFQEMMTEGDREHIKSFADLEALLRHLIREVYEEHYEFPKIGNDLAAAIADESRAELVDLIPGLFDGETPGGSLRIDTKEPDKL